MEVFYLYCAFSVLFMLGFIALTEQAFPTWVRLLLVTFGFLVMPLMLGCRFAETFKS